MERQCLVRLRNPAHTVVVARKKDVVDILGAPKMRDGLRFCDSPGCDALGEHRAPRSRDSLNHYYWFCLEHVRAYNARWNFYAGLSQAEIEKTDPRRHHMVASDLALGDPQRAPRSRAIGWPRHRFRRLRPGRLGSGTHPIWQWGCRRMATAPRIRRIGGPRHSQSRAARDTGRCQGALQRPRQTTSPRRHRRQQGSGRTAEGNQPRLFDPARQ